MATQVSYRVGSFTGGMMLGVALLIDGAQFILAFIPGFNVIFDPLLSAVAIMTFGMWFFFCGVSYFGGSKAGTKISSMLATSVIEMIPFIDALPGITMGVASIIYASRAEDREKAKSAPPPQAPSRGNPNSKYTQSEYYQNLQALDEDPEEYGESDESFEEEGDSEEVVS